ncbi:MAG: protein O-GlcNAcase [Victivallaceae bacterium]|nr:protein O-GlcNAcase [Victivallaceae bacterium]
MKRILITGLTLLLVFTAGMKLIAATKPTVIIIPEPKEEQYHNSKIVIVEKRQAKVSIVHDKNRVIATELANIIKQKSGATVTVESNTVPSSPALIIMDIGGKHPAVNELKINIPMQPEGYAIKTGIWRGRPIIVLAGRDRAGLCWSVQTLRQLLLLQSGNLTLPQCSIRDWPDFSYRSMGGQDSLNAIKHNLQYKINISFLPPWERDIRGQWDMPAPSYLKRLKTAIEYILPRGGLVNQWVEPYDSGQGDKPSQHNIVCSNDKDIQAYYNTFKKGLKLGNKLITIGIDDHAGNPRHLNLQDKEQFGTPAGVHAYLVSRIANQVNKDFPGTIICVVPGNYHGSEDIKTYYDKAGVPKNVVIMWTGAKTISFDFATQDVAALVKGIEGRRFVVFDNTFAQPLGKNRGPVLFEQYAVGYQALTETDKCLGLHVMGVMNRNVRFTIKGMQIADYLWNAKRYNPERSRLRVLTQIAGAEAVKPLLAFRRKMIKVAKDFPIEKTIARLNKGYLKSIIVTEQQYKTNLEWLKQANAYLQQIEKTCKNKALIAELQQMHKNGIAIVNYFYHKSRKGKTIKPEGIVTFEFPADIVGGIYFRNYAWKCPKRNGVAVYGRGKPGGAKAFINFKLTELPTKEIKLSIEGQACHGIVFAIRINGTTLIENKDIFPYGNWKTKQLTIKKSLLKPGLNVIEFETMNAGAAWVMISKVELKF